MIRVGLHSVGAHVAGAVTLTLLCGSPAQALTALPADAIVVVLGAASDDLYDESAWDDDDPDPDAPEAGVTQDPWEGFNRQIFGFNEQLDHYVLEPVATGWDFVVPNFVQTGIRNMYDNIKFPVTFVNDLLQGQPVEAGVTLGRFLLNSTVGAAGFFDAAIEAGLEKHESDFGQTLGVWGVPPGPYLVLPLYGASSPRDTVGLAVDSVTRVYGFFIPIWASVTITGVDVVNRRSLLLETIREERKSAFDFYVFVRNLHIKSRANKVRGVEDSEEENSPESDEDLYYFDDDEE
jgi:phospholipid-binding lipoprotein MlaA